jgi:hypothetical protein
MSAPPEITSPGAELADDDGDGGNHRGDVAPQPVLEGLVSSRPVPSPVAIGTPHCLTVRCLAVAVPPAAVTDRGARR